jgi:hypothetical protein
MVYLPMLEVVFLEVPGREGREKKNSLKPWVKNALSRVSGIFDDKWPWQLASLTLLALYRLRNNSYAFQIKMCKTLTIGHCLT